MKLKRNLLITINAIVSITLSGLISSCSQNSENIAELSAPVAYAIARNAIKQKKPNGHMYLSVSWSDLRMGDNDWPIGRVSFVATTPEFPNQQAKIDYFLDGTYNAIAQVHLPDKESEQIKVNLHESAVITGQSEKAENYLLALGREIASGLQNRRTAVFDLQGLNGEKTVLGMRVSESLITSLVRQKVPVVERRLLDPVFKEISLEYQGFTSEAGEQVRKRIGEFLGADIIVTGTLKLDKESVVINVRSVEVANGTVRSVAQAIVPRYLFRFDDFKVINN
jgi:TolB-like protein